MLLGHLTCTFVLGDLLKKVKKDINIPLMIFGALLPDLIDKPLAACCHVSGRGVAHSLVIQAVFCYFAIRLLNKRRDAVLTIYAGCLIHILQDWPQTNILFWPLAGVWDFNLPTTHFQKAYVYYILRMGSVKWWIEVFGFVYIIFKLSDSFREKRLEPVED